MAKTWKQKALALALALAIATTFAAPALAQDALPGQTPAVVETAEPEQGTSAQTGAAEPEQQLSTEGSGPAKEEAAGPASSQAEVPDESSVPEETPDPEEAVAAAPPQPAATVPEKAEELAQYDPLAAGAEQAFEEELAARAALAEKDSGVALFSVEESWAQAMDRVRTALASRALSVNVSDLNLPTETVGALYGDIYCTAGGYTVSDVMWYCYPSTGMASSINLTYYSQDECDRMRATADQLIAIAQTGETPLEKALLLHDQIVLRTGYDTKNYYLTGSIPKESYNAYGVLLNGTAVCDGYAKAYAALLNEMGIPALRVSSDALNHAWNFVQLNDNWYHVDCTWDDPVYGSSWDSAVSSSDALGTCRHASFLSSTQSFQTSTLNGRLHNATDYAVFNGSTANIAGAATDTTYDDMWWLNVDSAISPCGDAWYFAAANNLYWRSDLVSGSSEQLINSASQNIALLGTRLYVSKGKCRLSDTIQEYIIDPEAHALALGRTLEQPNYGIAAYDNTLYYVESNGAYRQNVAKLSLAEPGAITTTEYEIDNGFLRNIDPGTTAAELLAGLVSDYEILLLNADGTPAASGARLCTGMTVDVAGGGSALTVVVYGDLNGDGKVDMSDLIEMRRAMLKFTTLDEQSLEAATPTSHDDVPGMMDLILMRRYMLRYTNTMIS